MRCDSTRRPAPRACHPVPPCDSVPSQGSPVDGPHIACHSSPPTRVPSHHARIPILLRIAASRTQGLRPASPQHDSPVHRKLSQLPLPALA
eukprot:scaffold133413_cov99-Phaeocystis_antarctica.AAC.2